MKKLKSVAKTTAKDISKAIGASLTRDELDKITGLVAEAMEQAVRKSGKRNMESCIQHLNPDTDLAHQIQQEIKLKNEALITNLSSLR